MRCEPFKTMQQRGKCRGLATAAAAAGTTVVAVAPRRQLTQRQGVGATVATEQQTTRLRSQRRHGGRG